MNEELRREEYEKDDAIYPCDLAENHGRSIDTNIEPDGKNEVEHSSEGTIVI